MRKRWTREEMTERFRKSYPAPMWDEELAHYYDFLEAHSDNEAAKTLHDLMMDQEIVYNDRTYVIFDNEQIGLAYTRMVFELGDELVQYLKSKT